MYLDAEPVIGAIYSAIAGVVNGLGGIVEAVGNLIGQEWGFSMPTHPPQIPYLAQGAVLPANKPFLAMVGDQKHGTNVEAPLATIQEALANVLAQQGMGGDIHITFTGDLAQLGRGDLSVLGSIGWRKPGFPKADS